MRGGGDEIGGNELTALCGGQIAIRHLDDRALLINLMQGEVIKNGASLLSVATTVI